MDRFDIYVLEVFQDRTTEIFQISLVNRKNSREGGCIG
jgi:hypothetical protein